VQACFGRKYLNEILTEIFGPQFFLSFNEIFNLQEEKDSSKIKLNLRSNRNIKKINLGKFQL